jgi:hypothetical protein
MKYRTKDGAEVQAHQWNLDKTNRPDPLVRPFLSKDGFRDGWWCPYCHAKMHFHGEIAGQAAFVCPDDWLVVDKNGVVKSYNPLEFEKMFEKVP